MNTFMKNAEREAFFRQSRNLGRSFDSEDVAYTARKVRKAPSYWPLLVLANSELAQRVATIALGERGNEQ